MTRRISNFLAASALALGLAACTFLVDHDAEHCSSNADCAARGDAFADAVCTAGACVAKPVGTAFSCVNPTSETRPLTFDGKAYFYDVFATLSGRTSAEINGFKFAPIADSPLDVCLTADLDCAQPKDSLKSDAQGAIDITFGSVTPNYLKLTDTRYFPTIYFAPQGYRDTDKTIFVGRTTVQSLNTFTSSASLDITSTVGPDPTTGILIVNTFGCDRRVAAGVSWEIDDPDATRAYVEGSLLSTQAATTDQTGIVWFVNAKPGSKRITGKFQGVEVEARTVIVKPGTLTLVHAWPP